MFVEVFQYAFTICRIWWIEEGDIENQSLLSSVPSQKLRRLGTHNFYLVLDSQRVKILFNQRAHPSGPIDKRDVRRAARERFNSNCARTGTEIQKPRACDLRRKNIEKRLAQTIRSRPRL